jgi:hypothetical protein
MDVFPEYRGKYGNKENAVNDDERNREEGYQSQ